MNCGPIWSESLLLSQIVGLRDESFGSFDSFGSGSHQRRMVPVETPLPRSAE